MSLKVQGVESRVAVVLVRGCNGFSLGVQWVRARGQWFESGCSGLSLGMQWIQLGCGGLSLRCGGLSLGAQGVKSGGTGG